MADSVTIRANQCVLSLPDVLHTSLVCHPYTWCKSLCSSVLLLFVPTTSCLVYQASARKFLLPPKNPCNRLHVTVQLRVTLFKP
jgi:hypothetical protein